MGTTEMESALANWVCARLSDNSSQLTAVYSNSQLTIVNSFSTSLFRSPLSTLSSLQFGPMPFTVLDHLPYWPVNVVTCLRPHLSSLGLVICLLLLLLLDELTNLSHLAEFLQPLLRVVAFPSPKWSPRSVLSWECVSMWLGAKRGHWSGAVAGHQCVDRQCRLQWSSPLSLCPLHLPTKQSLSSAVVSSIDSLPLGSYSSLPEASFHFPCSNSVSRSSFPFLRLQESSVAREEDKRRQGEKTTQHYTHDGFGTWCHWVNTKTK